jgi:hypothetical protein
VGFIKTGISAIGKLAVVAILLTAFLGAMAGVVYMSLSGKEIIVPEITGKDFFESEKELAALGLKIKRRADRPSGERVNTVLEQLPKAGETVKTGQLIFVVVSKASLEGEEAPKSLIKDLETDDSETIKDMIDDKPKKAKANSNANAKKKADTTRDVNSNDSNSNSNSDDKSNSKSDDPDKKGGDQVKEPGDKGNKNTSTSSGPKPQASPSKPATRDSRTRIQPKP